MVHIKKVELSHFKSFGGTTAVPLLPGFTVVSGPNGSGKSNILDALLFALGLSSSKGMRAERLPDLINHKQMSNRSTSQASVTVTFDLSDAEEILPEKSLANGHHPENGHVETNGHQSLPTEWTVTRRLRVTKAGSYSSTYYINGETCTATELHQQLNRLRIYPEGYNVVLQGDVTRIITMNGRERREIIDELAGVAEFDRKIGQVRLTLDSVKEREERCEIIKEELNRNCERLAADRIKAEKYQKLKAQIQEKQQWEVVLIWKSLQQQVTQLQGEIEQGKQQESQLQQQLEILTGQISQTQTQLEKLNLRVKALGEDEQIAVASQLAQYEAKQNQLIQRQQELVQSIQDNETASQENSQKIAQYQHNLTQKKQEQVWLETEEIENLSQKYQQAQQILEQNREKAHQIAAASEAWVQEQAQLNHQINELQKILNPQRTEQAQLQERFSQLENKISQQQEQLESVNLELSSKHSQHENIIVEIDASETKFQSLAEKLAVAEQNQQIQQDTQSRLLREQRDKQRELDKLEATNQAQQEAQGSYATKLIMSADLPGVCGLVAQLGQVEPQYQLALETAAGGRLGHVVVEDDSIAAAGIELLKQKRAGRATFLPLNKIQAPRLNDTVALRYAQGFIAQAVSLIDCESRYQKIFAYVFGNTVVFASLNDARPYLGKQRIVTLQGELLESSGAMTGGSVNRRNAFHFGIVAQTESLEMQALKQRLQEIELILERCELEISNKTGLIKQLSQDLNETKQNIREKQLKLEQLNKDIERLTKEKEGLSPQLEENIREFALSRQRLQVLAQSLPEQEAQLQQQQQHLATLEASQTHSEWQAMQKLIKTQETEVQSSSEALRQAQTKLKDLENNCLRLEEKITESQQKLTALEIQKGELTQKQQENSQEIKQLNTQIDETKTQLAQLSAQLGTAKQERDRTESQLRNFQHTQQQTAWQQEKLTETQQQRQESLVNLQTQLNAQATELPDPLPEIPELVNQEATENPTSHNFAQQLEQLQQEIRRAQKRLQGMEPVNMLALEEYDRTQARLQELSAKLETIAAERTELLLRIENFTTLRRRAFMEAFDAVNTNFQSIFATLSDGDGYLGLENPEDPFAGGLNLIAHPKGKPVQRLSSMSGGEKSLTALSFIFSLQRYRPSPFYAFDEVDMFLDGANVERLAKMIKQQAQQAQFIVVSLRRPMIESSQRTIGVTQARGAHTQVLGIKL